ncbi:hypothetical protein BWR19_15920 [Halomonas sp. 1513]|nr:hypothetical protein [Halomonas sp. 1513]APX94301.1 hypothetical protein BWR19_15920 [Halomonas sp. 1513]
MNQKAKTTPVEHQDPLAAPAAFIPDVDKAAAALRAVAGLLEDNAHRRDEERMDDVTEYGLACCVGLAADYLDGVILEMLEASPGHPARAGKGGKP